MLFFIHIPKTGGTSIYNALRRMAPDKMVWYTGPDTAPANILSMPDIRKSTSIYAGHFGYRQISSFLVPGDTIYSVIREPVERVLSTYNHIAVRDTKHRIHNQIKELSLIKATQRCFEFREEISNLQCRYLSGVRGFKDTLKVVTTQNVHIYTMSQLHSLIAHMAAECGIADPPQIGRDNVAKNDYKDHITTEEIEFAAQLNQEDVKLYSYFGGYTGARRVEHDFRVAMTTTHLGPWSGRLTELASESYDTQFITQLYRIFFDRNPDPDGLEVHMTALRSGILPHELVAKFLKSKEFIARQGRGAIPKHALPDLKER